MLQTRRGPRTAVALAAAVFTSLVLAAARAARAFLSRATIADVARDDLTGLATRAALTRHGDRRLTELAGGTAVVLVDLDDFKAINDSLGHAAGDRVLAEVGRRLRAGLRPTDLAVRLGGDEIALLVRGLRDADDVEEVAARLVDALAVPYRLDDLEVSATASLGVAVHGHDGSTVDELLAVADTEMYRAKAAGGGCWRRAGHRDVDGAAPAEAAQAAGREDRRPLDAAALAAAVADGQVAVHVAPQVDSLTGWVTGFEAHLTWEHVEHGRLAAADFLALAERSGLSRSLVTTLLDGALGDLARLQEAAAVADGERPAMTVCLTPRNLMARSLVDDVTAALARHGVAAAHLQVDVPEAVLGASGAVAETLAGLAALGCGIRVRDFGAGTTSLAALAGYAARGAVREVVVPTPLLLVAAGVAAGAASDALVVRSLADVARSLDLAVTAGGVRTAAEAGVARELGCDRVQGSHVHPGAPGGEVVAWLRATYDTVRPLDLEV